MSKEILFSPDELQKMAVYLSGTGQLLKQATQTAKDLLTENEKLAAELAELKDKGHKAERKVTIDKIAEMLTEHGLISKTAMSQKISELEKLSDEALSQFESTIRGLNGTPAEKQAAEGTFSTLAFLQPFELDELPSDGRPRPIQL